MTRIIIHIGAPRTGTTVLQSHLFKLASNYLVFSKRPFEATGTPSTTEPGIAIGKFKEIKKYLEDPNTEDHLKNNKSEFANNALFMPCLACSNHQYGESVKKNKYYNLLVRAAQRIHEASLVANKGILISSERLCSTDAAMIGAIEETNWVKIQPFIALVQALNEITSTKITVSACLRSPIMFMRSRYLRTFLQRKYMKLPALTVREYIANQIALEKAHGGSSALAPALHRSFVSQIERHATAKTFGFQELLKSENVFKTMGLCGEEHYKFKNFPRENEVPFTKEQQNFIESEIILALKQNDFYKKIKEEQLYE